MPAGKRKKKLLLLEALGAGREVDSATDLELSHGFRAQCWSQRYYLCNCFLPLTRNDSGLFKLLSRKTLKSFFQGIALDILS